MPYSKKLDIQNMLDQITNSNKKSEYGISYLIADNGQYLGKITSNNYDKDSILNEYGAYGSSYSNTSIFNNYSPYGSKYGQYSINNPYCIMPPKLIINNTLLGYVTINPYVQMAISTDDFIYTLKRDIGSLLQGQILTPVNAPPTLDTDSYILAEDGTFLGSLEKNKFNSNSIYNKFGPYGNRFSPTSIFNRFGIYGNLFSSYSAYNTITATPPKVYINNNFVAFLTKNSVLQPSVDPDGLFDWLE